MRCFIVRYGLYTLCAVILAQNVHAEDAGVNLCAADSVVGEVLSVQGKVEILDTQGVLLRRLAPGRVNKPDAKRRLCAGETLRTGPLARATLAVTEPPSVIRLDANTFLATENAVNEPVFSSQQSSVAENRPIDVIALCRSAINRVWLDLRRGALRLFTTEPTRLDIKTPYLNASVEGTEFSLLVTESTSQVSVVDGVVGACNVHGGTAVRSGQTASAEAGQQPVIIDSANTVHWALHYPTLDSMLQGTRRSRDALELMVAGRVGDALALLGDDFSAVDLALRAIIAITTNNQKVARELAQRSVRLDDRSPIAWTALSYVQQANYELEAALASATTSVQLAPDNAVGLTRLAELEFIAGDISRAETIAKQAIQSAPDLSRTHSVLGFILLDGYNMASAGSAFLQAIEHDETDPLPRLGLALIQTRQGNIHDALSKLEAAVSLDPENSLLRAYLGRLYALDNRRNQALDQFRLAEQIDTSDPLPHLYRAFVHHDNNNIHLALDDLQTALDKNGNRGVFRTRSLLDADLAITLAARGRIYEELGFSNLTRREGTDAIYRNPRDHAAHRLMADAYRFRPRHEIARASEQLQAQIRQPLNANPIPSSLGLSRLDDFPDSGPRSISLNEYARLFSQQGLTASISQANGPYGTTATELKTNWLFPASLASASYYQSETNGPDFNRDGQFELSSLYLQQWFGNRLSAQIELSDTRSQGGADRQLRFNRDSYNKLDRFNENRKRSRLGLRWSYSEHTDLYLNHDNSRFARRLFGAPDGGEKQLDTDSHHSEAQLATTTRNIDRVLGISYSNQESEQYCSGSIFGNQSEETRKSMVDHTVAYGYAYPTHQFSNGSRIDYTFGVGFDDLKVQGVDDHFASPKLGINIDQGRFRWRSVLARTVTRTLATNRTLEPTQIAGFSQFYDDFAGTVATLAGLGAGVQIGFTPHRAAGNVYLDAELVHRQLEKPTATDASCIPSPSDGTTEFEERRFSLGIFTSMRQLSIALRFEHEEYMSPDGVSSFNSFVNSTTERAALELSKSINPHMTFRIKPQYVRQSGTFYDDFAQDVYSGRDSFWTLDTALELQLDAALGNRVAGSLTIELNNLLDAEFNFQEPDAAVPSLSYDRELSIRLQLSYD